MTQFLVTGEYGRPLPENIAEGLIAEITNHLKAYGFKEISVTQVPEAKKSVADRLWEGYYSQP